MFNLPAVALEVTQHDLVARECSCGTVTKADAPTGVDAPVQYGPRLAGAGVYLFHGQFLSKARTAAALGDLFGAHVAAGTVASWTHRAAQTIAEEVIPVIALTGSPRRRWRISTRPGCARRGSWRGCTRRPPTPMSC